MQITDTQWACYSSRQTDLIFLVHLPTQFSPISNLFESLWFSPSFLFSSSSNHRCLLTLWLLNLHQLTRGWWWWWRLWWRWRWKWELTLWLLLLLLLPALHYFVRSSEITLQFHQIPLPTSQTCHVYVNDNNDDNNKDNKYNKYNEDNGSSVITLWFHQNLPSYFFSCSTAHSWQVETKSKTSIVQ